VADHVKKRVTSASCTPQGIMQHYDANCKIMKTQQHYMKMKVVRLALIEKVDGV
jgi:hypothetical protein